MERIKRTHQYDSVSAFFSTTYIMKLPTAIHKSVRQFLRQKGYFICLRAIIYCIVGKSSKAHQRAHPFYANNPVSFFYIPLCYTHITLATIQHILKYPR